MTSPHEEKGAPRALTRAGASLAAAGLSLLVAGIGLGNVELLLLSAFPLLLLAATLAQRVTTEPRASLTLATRKPKRGDAVDVVMRLDAPRGHDLVELHAPLPDSFTLETGSNLMLRAGHGKAVAAFRARPQARGHHEVGPLRAESIDPSGLLAPRTYTLGEPEAIAVAARVFRRARMRGRLRARGSHSANVMEESRQGSRSTDFRELRDYAWGDPPSAIHWKATARRLSARSGDTRGAIPIVTEYEREGRRAVFVLLDGGASLRVGTSQSTGLDAAVEAALTLASHFLDGGARVGAATYGASAGAPAYPESGTGRFGAIERALDPGSVDASSTLTGALERAHGHLVGGSPLLVVVTRLTHESARDIAHAARRLRALLRERRRELPMVIVDVRALHLAPTPTAAWESARALVERDDERAANVVRAAGGRIIAWRPDQEDFLHAFLRRGAA